jgi:hypothetical protein
MSYSDYKKQVVLQQKGMDLDDKGEIVVAGSRLRDTMPAADARDFSQRVGS